MPLTQTSIAGTVAVGVKNTQFLAQSQNLERKIAIIGTYEAGKIITDNVPAQSIDPQQTAAIYGFGSMLHRLHLAAQKGSRGLPTYIIPQPEEGGAVAATGKITTTVTTSESGTISLYVAGELISVAVAAGDSQDTITTNIIAAITAAVNNPLNAVVNGINANEADLTAKMKGTYGNFVSIKTNLKGEELPGGVTIVITDMSAGATDPDIQDALDGTGLNEEWFTDLIHGYGQVADPLDKLSTFNGPGNDFVGLYEKVIARPFRSLTGNVEPGGSALTALIALGDGRKTDRTNGIVAVPGSPNHPSEIAAQVVGAMARIAASNAAQHYSDELLIDVLPGAAADRWTDDYNNNDQAEKAGVSPTIVKNGAVYILDLLTFYHPDEVASASNGYRYQVSISKIQNIINSTRLNFQGDRWKQTIIVNDAARARRNQKARDIDAVLTDLVALAQDFEAIAWIADADFTIDNQTVVINAENSNRFDITFPVTLSANARIFDTTVEFDVSFAILL